MGLCARALRRSVIQTPLRWNIVWVREVACLPWWMWSWVENLTPKMDAGVLGTGALVPRLP